MAITERVFSGDTLRVGYRFQRHWDNSMAYAFFFCEVGAGLFLISLLLDNLVGMAVGLLLVSTGKPWFHLTHMGVPRKSWRAALRPDRSWISRGLLALVGMVGFGALVLLVQLFGEGANTTLLWGLKLLAGFFALVCASYQGFAMSHSSAISIWNSAIMPLSGLLYALTCGLALVLPALPAESAAGLSATLLLLLLGLALMHLMFLHAGWHGGPGARTSIELLLQTFYARWYLGVTLAAGIALPALLTWVAPLSNLAQLLSAVVVLAGFFAWRLLIFKIGVYEPIMSMNPFAPGR